MKKALEDRIQKMLAEEGQADVDNELLDVLRTMAAMEVDWIDLTAPQRNALNVFFREVRELETAELIANKFGASIIMDSIIVTCFEVGYQLAKRAK